MLVPRPLYLASAWMLFHGIEFREEAENSKYLPVINIG